MVSYSGISQQRDRVIPSEGAQRRSRGIAGFPVEGPAARSGRSRFLAPLGMTTGSDDAPVAPDAHGAEADVNVAERDGEETQPREPHVPRVERAAPRVHPLANWTPREPIQVPADHVAKRV